MIIMVGLLIQMVVPASVFDIFARCGVISRPPRGRIFVPSLPLRLIWLSLVPEFTPTTPVK